MKGEENAQWISMNGMATMPVQHELYRTNLSENIGYLWVSCYNKDYQRAAWALFAYHSGSGRMIT